MTDTEAHVPANQAPTPLKWWQWLLVYSALPIALIGTMPTILEFYKSNKIGVAFGQTSIAESQNDLWRKNIECSAAPVKWYTTEENIKVDGTICKSGDVLIRVKPPNSLGGFSWVPLKGLVKVAANTSLTPIAYAEVINSNMQLAQQYSQVICQKFITDGKLLRRIDTGEGCIDEIVNTYTGRVIKRYSATCNPNC